LDVHWHAAASLLCIPLVAIWPPLEKIGREAPANSPKRALYVPPAVRFWVYETQNLGYALCCTFLASPVKRDEPEPGRDWLLAVWSLAQFVKLCEFILQVGVGEFMRDAHNIIEVMAVLLAVSSNALAVCNDSDWPGKMHINRTVASNRLSAIQRDESVRALGALTHGTSLESDDGMGLPGFNYGFGSVWKYCPKNDVPPLAAKYLLAFSIFLRWLNLVPRVMQRNATYGTLVLTCRLMVMDMLKWFFLATWMNVAFGAFFECLFKAPWASSSDPEHCEHLDDPDQYFENMGNVLLWTYEKIAGGGINYHCMAESSAGVVAFIMIIFFQLVQIIMLINTLIAMMAKTFDSISENTQTYFLYIKALQIYTWRQYPSVPPPLNMLSLPYNLLILPLQTAVLALCGRGCRRSTPAHANSSKQKMERLFRRSSRPSLDDPNMAGSEHDRALNIFFFPDSWLTEHDVETIVGNAIKFGRDSENQSEQLARQIFGLSERFEELSQEMRAHAMTAASPSALSDRSGGLLPPTTCACLSSSGTTRGGSLASMMEKSRREGAERSRQAALKSMNKVAEALMSNIGTAITSTPSQQPGAEGSNVSTAAQRWKNARLSVRKDSLTRRPLSSSPKVSSADQAGTDLAGTSTSQAALRARDMRF